MKLETWADSHIGLVRKSNQDAIGHYPELSLFVVADGMGGRSEGEVASHLAVTTIREVIETDRVALASSADVAQERPRFWDVVRGVRPRDALREPSDGPDLQAAVSAANQRVYEAGQNHPDDPRGSMGTTVVVLVCALPQRQAYWAHVGDSRLYRMRAGQLQLLTADHTLFGEGYWNQAHVPVDLPHTNQLIRAIGIEPTVDVTCGSDELRVGDLYLLCSDGISGMIAPADLHELLLRSASVPETGQSLVRLALAGGGRDNASAMLVRITED